MKDRPLVVQAPAKLNLCLNITGRREDGYHLLDSLFVFCDLYDTITISEAPGLEMVPVTGRFAGLIEGDEQNLVFRTARLLQAEAGIKTGARLALDKAIPVAAGLGGGSADAAAVLRGLNQFWGLHWPMERLETLAAQLGADVPACVQSRPVMAKGIGDVLSEAPDLPFCGLLLVNPLLPTPTPQVFRAYGEANKSIAEKQLSSLPVAFSDIAVLTDFMRSRGNDLTVPAQKVQPAIGDVLAAVKQIPDVAFAGMSGSGATCFGLFETQAKAERAHALLLQNQSTWWIWSGGWHQT